MLCPFENTRLDKFIDIAFTAAMDASEQDESNFDEKNQTGKQIVTPKEIINQKRSEIIAACSRKLKEPLIRKTAALYWNPNNKNAHRIVCTISKKYDRSGGYWYGLHMKWREFLNNADVGLIALGCVDRQEGYLMPISFFEENIEKLNLTEKDDKKYWHIHLENNDHIEIAFNNGERISLEQYKINL